MINYEKVAEKIFSTIKGHGHDLIMFTEEGMETSDAQEARRFFVKQPNYMVTLDGEARHIKINKNSSVSLEDMESIMKQLKNLATANMLKTEIRVFGKEITPKDFAYQTKNMKGPAMENIQEASFSRMHGFKKTSYQTLESTKIIVRHRRPIDEEVRGSRARNIQAIFIEHAGERFRFPHNNLAGARAMARHINEGGNIQDSVGQYIVESIANYNKLMEFVRYARTNKLINETSEDIIKTVRESVGVIRREIGQLQGAKTYGTMSETIQTRDPNVIEEDDTADLQDMFTVRKFDEKIGDILPIVKKLMDNKQVWRNALVEASEKEIAISEKTELSETEVFEFDSPVQRMGYQVKDVASRMIGESDLQKFVGKVAGKLIEGEQISAFEKKVVGNVLGNAVIREEEEICEGCGELCESCKCGPKDVVELISDSYDLKMKMIEHEDIFAEGLADADEGVLQKVECPECGDLSMEFQGQRGDYFDYECNTCGEEQTEYLPKTDAQYCPDCKGTGLDSETIFDEPCPTCNGEGAVDPASEGMYESASAFPNMKEWWNEDPKDIMDFAYWRKRQMPPSDENLYAKNWNKLVKSLSAKNPPPAGWENPISAPGAFERKCDHCFGRGINPTDKTEACRKCDGEGKYMDESLGEADIGMTSDDEWNAEIARGEAEAGANMGMPDTPDECANCSSVAVIDGECGVCGYFEEPEDDGQPSEYDEWQDYMGGDDWDHGQFDESLNELRKAAGIDIKEESEQLYTVWRYTTGNEGASGYTVDLKKVPLSQAIEYLDSDIEDFKERDGVDDGHYKFDVTIGERKQKAHYNGAVVIRQTIKLDDATEESHGYYDHSHTYYIGPSYWNPRKG